MDNLDKYIKDLKSNTTKSMPFIDYLNYLLNLKNLSASDVYTSVEISRQTWSKIISGTIKPSLNTAIKIAIGLHCSNEECKLLLKKLNYTLSRSDDFSIVIRYCLDNKIYNLIEINKLLYSKNLAVLD